MNVFVSGAAGLYSDSPLLGALVFTAMLAMVCAYFTACAPLRQRDEARRELAKLRADEQPAKRRLTEAQTISLADAVRNSGVRPKSLNVLYRDDPECEDFAVDLGDAFKSAGLEVSVHKGIFYDAEPRARGVQIVRSKEKTMRLLADLIFAELRAGGFAPERRDNNDPGQIFLHVSRAPDAPFQRPAS